jgi:HEAT repeat protein
MGKEAHDVLRQLTLALKDSSLEVRHAATQAICELKHDAALCVPALAGALNHATGDLRDALVKAITAFGKDGVEPLLGGLTQRPGKVMATILPVVEAKPKTYVDGVVSRLLTGDPVTVKENAADLLTRLGADASSAEKKLIEALSNDSVLVRVKVIRTLGRVAKPGKAIDDTLRQLAEDDTRISVLDAIDEAKLYLRARARQ